MAETLGSYGAAVLAALTMQEGGACGNFSREQIELFCFSHMIEVSFVSHLDHLEVNFDMPPDRLNLSDDGTLSSMEAAFQVCILSFFLSFLEILLRFDLRGVCLFCS